MKLVLIRQLCQWMAVFFCSGAVVAGSLTTPLPGDIPGSPGRVLIVENSGATQTYNPQDEAISNMVREGIRRFTGKDTARDAWLSLVATNDLIGIKVCSSPGGNSGTRPAVTGAVVASLLESGILPKNIIIWDRRLVDLRLAGNFELAAKYRVQIAASQAEGFDPDVSYEAALVGRLVYGDLEFGEKGEGVGRNSYVTKLLTQRITKIINITPLLNHNLAGVSGVLHGLAMGSVDNTLRFEQDPERLATAIPEIYALPQIGDRVVLNIVDALICQYQGEERTLLHYSSPVNQLWLSRDPVAVDTLAIEELQRQRRLAKRPEARVNMAIYANAALLDLGVAEPRRITVEKLSSR